MMSASSAALIELRFIGIRIAIATNTKIDRVVRQTQYVMIRRSTRRRFTA